MGLLGWGRENLLTTTLVALVSGFFAAISVLGVAAWGFLSLFVPGPQAALAALLPVFLLGIVIGAPIALVSALVVLFGLVSRATDAASGGFLQRVATRLERNSDLARLLGIADLASALDTRTPEQRADDRIAQLKERYVAGELSERDLERKMRELMDDEGVHRDNLSVSLIQDQLDRERERDRNRERE